jgi:hypothetical protein
MCDRSRFFCSVELTGYSTREVETESLSLIEDKHSCPHNIVLRVARFQYFDFKIHVLIIIFVFAVYAQSSRG